MTDLELKRIVESELRWEPSLKAPEAIGVGIKDGVVTLSGYVESYPEKLAAERAAARVSGVKGIVNKLEVRLIATVLETRLQPFSRERTDEDIARAAVNALEWTSGIPKDKIKVTVDKGWITLKGTVDWQFQRNAVETAVKSLTGVKGILNLIEVRPAVSKDVVKGAIEDAMKRLAELDAQRIQVDTVGSKVILRGTVRSWRERKEAERVAWQAPGVTEVDNQIEVVDVVEQQRRVS